MSISREDHEQKTCIPVNYAFLKWRIQSFHLWPVEKESVIESNRIYCCSSQWVIEVHSKSLDENFQIKNIGIYIRNPSCHAYEIKARIKVFLKDYRNENRYLREKEFTYKNPNDTFGWPDLVNTWEVLEEKRKELYPNDILTVCCEIAVLGKVYSTEMSKRSCLSELGSGEKSFYCYDELCELFKDEIKVPKYNDMILKTREQNFAVHKAVLAAYSPVLARQLQGIAHCKVANTMEILDFDESVVINFICFMYSGGVFDMSFEKVMSLLFFAEAYQVQELTNSCAHYLSHMISLDNFFNMVDIVDRIQNEHLLEAIKKFFSRNFAKIILERDWAFLVRKYPRIVAEMKACHPLIACETEFS